MMLRLATLSALCLPILAFGTAMAATPDTSMPQVLAPAQIPTIQAIRADTRSAAIVAPDSAPMPDADAAAPVAEQSTDSSVQPAFYGRKDQFRGDGFANGSTAQSVQDRSIRPAAGLALNVPLD